MQPLKEISVDKRGKVGAIPGCAPFEVQIEKVHLLRKCTGNAWMCYQVIVERSGATSLTSKDDEVGH